MAGIEFDIQVDIKTDRIEQACTVAEHALAVEVMKDTEPYVPALTKSLVNRSQAIGDTIFYPGPYARYLYYGKVMVDAATGKGPMKIVDKDGSMILRFRKGATLKPTDRDLNISKVVHPQAQSHWFEASKAVNLDKWLRFTGRLVGRELG